MTSSPSIAIIGAGFYGCHIAESLLRLGFKVDIFESAGDVLTRASANNQFRLHQGFHYPRNFATRTQSMEGFQLFRERYPMLRHQIQHNVYAVSQTESLIDFKTYRSIMASSGLDFSDVDPGEYGLRDCEGAVRTAEEYVDISAARTFFRGKLSKSLHLNSPIDIQQISNDPSFSYIIDCTWGHAQILPGVYYEPCLLLYYQDGDNRYRDHAITLVDGDLCSLYPTDTKDLLTLSSVPFTPLGKYATSVEAVLRLRSITADEIEFKRKAFEDQMNYYLPDFLDGLEFVGPQLSIKTKPHGSSANRSCRVWSHNKVITVLSGKIDTVFHAFDQVISLIRA